MARLSPFEETLLLGALKFKVRGQYNRDTEDVARIEAVHPADKASQVGHGIWHGLGKHNQDVIMRAIRNKTKGGNAANSRDSIAAMPLQLRPHPGRAPKDA